MDCSSPGSSIHGIFQARVLEWGAIAFSVSCYRRTEFEGGWAESLAPPPGPRWIPEATPSCCRMAQRPYLIRRSACCSLLSSFLFESVEVLAPLMHGWNWLVASLCPTVSAPASFPGLCRFSGRGCFPLTGDPLAWCWEQVGLLLFSPHTPPKMYKGFLTHSSPWGSRGHPLSQGP